MTVVSGTIAAIQLLRQIERLNWDEERTAETRQAVRAAILTAANSESTLNGFASVIADWLTSEVMGFSFNLDDYEQDAIEGLLVR